MLPHISFSGEQKILFYKTSKSGLMFDLAVSGRWHVY